MNLSRLYIQMQLKHKYEQESWMQGDDPQMKEERYKQFIDRESKFTNALNALQEHYRPSQINSRVEEMIQIQAFIQNGIAAGGSAESLYVSGVPGIGKTLCVKQIAERICLQKKAMYIYTNALTIKRPLDIFRVIHYEMTKEKLQSRTALYQLDNFFERKTPLSGFNEKQHLCKVLIIDEIDFLKTNDFSILYSIFQWTQKKKSKLIIISISNTLDFPQTLTPKVASRMGKKSICFKPYTSAQIENILMERVGNLDIFEDTALTYICKKIAGCSSDIRKCLFILRDSIAQFLIENANSKILNKKKIPVDILAKTHEKIYTDNFVLCFKDFPSASKIILYCLAKYYRNNTYPCTMRQLQSLLGTFVKPKYRFQISSVLSDLRDLGIVKVFFSYRKMGEQTSSNSFKFPIIRELREQHIKLNVDHDRIFHALQKQNPKDIKFDINMNF